MCTFLENSKGSGDNCHFLIPKSSVEKIAGSAAYPFLIAGKCSKFGTLEEKDLLKKLILRGVHHG